MNEGNLYNILEDYGFTRVVTPITKFQKFLNRFYSTPKYTNTEHQYWLEKEIKGKKCEVYECDTWYCQLRIDGQVVFDARRFKNEELLRLLPS